MRSVRHRGVLGTVLALALTATAAGGCAGIPQRSPVQLRAGYDTLDGTLAVWPARGGLARDPAIGAAVTKAVEEWRTPIGDRVHLASSGILWLGEVDGEPLALVAANVPGGEASWLLQVTGQDRGFAVTRSVDYTDLGYLVYADVLPVHLPTGRRYLTSTRVQRVLGPDGVELRLTDGLSAPVDVPGCAAVPVTAVLRPTASLPQGRSADRLVDLGTATDDPRYPLVRDGAGSGATALAGLDTCALAAEAGPFGSIPRRDAHGDEVDGVPMSWPLDRISMRPLNEVDLGQGPPVRLEQLQWRTDAGSMSAIVYRPEAGPPVVSRADRASALQTYVVRVDGRSFVVLVWRPDPDTTLSVPADASPLVDLPGLVVLPESPREQTYRLHTPDKSYHRSVTDRGVEPPPDSD